MRIQSPNNHVVDGSVFGREGELEGLKGSLCYRCGQPPEIAHDRFFCPAFSEYGEAGMWVPFNRILRTIRKHVKGRTISVWTTNRVEELEGPLNEWHHVVGMAIEGKYVGRFDYPYMPEFSIWKPSDRVWDLEHGSIAARSNHSMFYKGWRVALRPLRGVIPDWFKFCKELGISPDHSTEELARRKSGWT